MGLILLSLSVNAESDSLSIFERTRSAAVNALNEANVAPNDTAYLINTSVYRDHNIVEPAIAALVQKKLELGLVFTPGQPSTFSFDLMNGACGVLNAVQVLQGLLSENTGHHGLIVSGDTHPSMDPEQSLHFPYGAVGAAIVVKYIPGESGFGTLCTASSSDTHVPVEGYLPLRSMGSQGRSTVIIERPDASVSRLADFAVSAAQSAISKDNLSLSTTLIISSNPAPDFSSKLAEGLGVPVHAVCTAEGAKDAHTSSIPLAYLQAQLAGKLTSVSHILFIAAGGGPTSAAISYRIPDRA